jgi:hypothetical protein
MPGAGAVILVGAVSFVAGIAVGQCESVRNRYNKTKEKIMQWKQSDSKSKSSDKSGQK